MRAIKQRIIDILDRQEKKGFATYGRSLENAHFDENGEPYDWNLMALEELVDALQYMIKENLALEHEIEEAHHIISELDNDLDECDHKVREMLYGNDNDGEY